MNDCESCMLHYYDADYGQVCIGNFDEFDNRKNLLYKLRQKCVEEMRKTKHYTWCLISEETQKQFNLDVSIKFPCKYHTTIDEFITWKEQQH